MFRFVLTDVLVDGNTVYTEDELLPLWEELLGQESTLTLFYGIAAAVSVRYRNDGYILARAFVPPQEIIDGFTDIEVIEGYNNIVIEGEQSGSAAQIEDKKEAIKAPSTAARAGPWQVSQLRTAVRSKSGGRYVVLGICVRCATPLVGGCRSVASLR